MNSAAVYPPLNATAGNAFTNVPGYEGIGGGFLPPPAPLQPVAPPQPGPTPDEWNITDLSEDDARDAFKEYVQSQCCYQSGPAEDAVFTSLESHHTYRLRLETFTESRSTEQAEKPYEGETPDFYTQQAPTPWQVEAKTPNLFTDHTEEIRVPFTSSVKECNACHAEGKVPCKKCEGKGTKKCSHCDGSGKRMEENCIFCKGSGKDRCSNCNAEGKTKCDICDGKKKLLTYIKLKVEWKNNVDNKFVEGESGLNTKELHSVNGKELFKMTQTLVYPLYGFPNTKIVELSDQMVKEHQTKYAQSSRILQQRQTVELIPLTKVDYKWKNKIYCFYVYGNENQVSAKDYPETCCCVIL